MPMLTSAERVQAEKVSEGVTDALQELNDAIQNYNGTAALLIEKIDDAQTHLNSKIEEHNDFAMAVFTRLESEYDAKSESWQDGDKGQEFNSWMGEWEEGVDDVNIDLPEEMDEVELDEPLAIDRPMEC